MSGKELKLIRDARVLNFEADRQSRSWEAASASHDYDNDTDTDTDRPTSRSSDTNQEAL